MECGAAGGLESRVVWRFKEGDMAGEKGREGGSW